MSSKLVLSKKLLFPNQLDSKLFFQNSLLRNMIKLGVKVVSQCQNIRRMKVTFREFLPCFMYPFILLMYVMQEFVL